MYIYIYTCIDWIYVCMPISITYNLSQIIIYIYILYTYFEILYMRPFSPPGLSAKHNPIRIGVNKWLNSLDTTTRVDESFKHHRNVSHPCLVILRGSSWVESWICPLYLATSNPYKLAIWQENIEGGTCCLQQWCHPKKQLCSIVPASYETTMCCCGEVSSCTWIVSKQVECLFWTGEWWQPSKNQPPQSVLSRSASCTCPFCFCGLVCVGRAETNGWHNGCGKEP